MEALFSENEYNKISRCPVLDVLWYLPYTTVDLLGTSYG